MTISTANGCTATSNTTVVINALPTVSIDLTDNSCNSDDGVVLLGEAATLTATAGFSSYSIN